MDIGGGRTAFTPFAEYYQKYLDRACMDIVTGAFDYNTVLRRVVKEMTAAEMCIRDRCIFITVMIIRSVMGLE